MAETAFQTVYRDELIAAFEVQATGLRSAVTNHAQIKGNTAIFGVAGSNGAVATTRGVNGLIAARPNDTTQSTCTLAEWHDLVRITDFNIFASQGDQRAQMQRTTMQVINRKIDLDIIAQLDTATQDMGAAAVASLAKVLHAKTILGNAGVDVSDEDNLFALVTPAVDAYLMQIAAYTSADYVESKPLVGPARKFRRWAGFNWIINSLLTGITTNAEKCYFFHKDSLGHAADTKGIESFVGYDQEQGYSYARASVKMGSKLLQNTGIVQFVHDGSAYVAT
jgi:hypothetical protein